MSYQVRYVRIGDIAARGGIGPAKQHHAAEAGVLAHALQELHARAGEAIHGTADGYQ